MLGSNPGPLRLRHWLSIFLAGLFLPGSGGPNSSQKQSNNLCWQGARDPICREPVRVRPPSCVYSASPWREIQVGILLYQDRFLHFLVTSHYWYWYRTRESTYVFEIRSIFGPIRIFLSRSGSSYPADPYRHTLIHIFLPCSRSFYPDQDLILIQMLLPWSKSSFPDPDLFTLIQIFSPWFGSSWCRSYPDPDLLTLIQIFLPWSDLLTLIQILLPWSRSSYPDQTFLPWSRSSYPDPHLFTLVQIFLHWSRSSYPDPDLLTLVQVFLPGSRSSYPDPDLLTLVQIFLPWSRSYPDSDLLTLIQIFLPRFRSSYLDPDPLILIHIFLPWSISSYPGPDLLTLIQFSYPDPGSSYSDQTFLLWSRSSRPDPDLLTLIQIVLSWSGSSFFMVLKCLNNISLFGICSVLPYPRVPPVRVPARPSRHRQDQPGSLPQGNK